MKIRFLLILSIFALVLKECEPANILVVAPFFATSHSLFIHSVATHLARKGHNMTIITTNIEKNPPPNYKQIVVTEELLLNVEVFDDMFGFRNLTIFEQLKVNWYTSNLMTNQLLNTTTFRNFIEYDKSHFDLVIVEYFHQEHMYMFSHKYKAPLALISSSTYNQHTFETMGIHLPLSYVPHDQYRSGRITNFYQRAFNTIASIYAEIGRSFYYMPIQEKLAQKYFSKLPQPLPSLKELEKNIELVMVNTHFSCDLVVPSVPGIVEIGGAHIKPMKKLPEDLQKFLDTATDGAILFALGGSHLESSKMHPEKIKAFIRAIGELNLKLIWKWEDDNPPKDKNVYVAKWLPLYDILGHPNIKAFISHGGKLSLLESMYQGVPVIGIPIFADQFVNLANLIDKGAALSINYYQIELSMVKDVIQKVTNDPGFELNAKKISEKLRDRQNDPLDSAAYWVNYILNHKGKNLLKSPQFNMRWYTYYMVDVLVFLAILIMSILVLIIAVFKCIKYAVSDKKDVNIKKIVNNTKKKNK